MNVDYNCVLLIDDDNATNFLNSWIIKKLNFSENIVIKKDGKQALDFLTTSVNGQFPKPRLILLDINMPVMNGWEFMDNYKILTDQQRAKIVLVLLTTSRNSKDIAKSKEYPDITGYENKPLSIKKMENIIKKYLLN